jgi:hypothetical protein
MSLNTTQTLALIDRNCHSTTASYPVADKIADINLALDKVFAIIFKAAGRWQFDDSNHTDYPFITTNLNASQRDYTFTADEQGNLILDVYKVMVKDTMGHYYEVYPVDLQSDYDMQSFYDGRNVEGIPCRYDKTANGILLDAVPSYSQTAGVKIFINREGSYFTTSDTTKKAGFAGLFHEYLALEPSARYCKRNKMFDLSDRYERDLLKMESEIKKYYRDRSRDELLTITSQTINPY